MGERAAAGDAHSQRESAAKRPLLEIGWKLKDNGIACRYRGNALDANQLRALWWCLIYFVVNSFNDSKNSKVLK